MCTLPAPRGVPWGPRPVTGRRPAIEHVIARGGDEISFERVRVAAIEDDHGDPALGWTVLLIGVVGVGAG